MKKIILGLILLIIAIADSYGQWYSKQYGVTDLNFLTKEQMEASMHDASFGILAAGAAAGIGGLIIWAGKSTLKNGLGEDPTFIEDLLGSEFIGKASIILGAVTVTGGAIAGLAYFIRHETIRSAISRNYGPAASLSLSPSIITTGIKRSSALGLTVSVNF